MNEQSLYLCHHGILGMKWGERNGPPYPLLASDHSASEKKAGWRKSLGNEEYDKQDKKLNKNNKKILAQLGISEEDAKNAAMALGLSLATVAGVYAVSYAIDVYGLNTLRRLHSTARDVNASGRVFSYRLNKILNVKSTSLSAPTGVGDKAFGLGYGHGSPKEFLDARKQAFSPDALIRNVRMNVVSGDAPRRLSCWSASHAYFLSRATGGDYISSDFNNLVNFNDFGNLYQRKQNIFSITGDAAKNFVGKPGINHVRCSGGDADVLLKSIAEHVKTSNCPDGSTVGFINAAYHNLGCTHQWNFEISKEGAMFIADGYSGERYNVGRIINGVFTRDYSSSSSQNFAKLVGELAHYNRDSIRFYSPLLSDINIQQMSEFVLGRFV